jgi:hypothetical protein
MTEEELFRHICSMAKADAVGRQPPFAEVAVPLHPDSPVDYEAERAKTFDEVLGKEDYLYHAPAGAPHIDVHRYPPGGERTFWCYATNGMSDFPQHLPDGNAFRSELVCCSHSADAIWAELLRVLGTFPFGARTCLHAYHTVPFPDGLGDPRFTYAMTIPPFVKPELADLRFLGEPLVVLSVIRITADERNMAVRTSSQSVVESLPDTLETWLIDGRREGM